MSASRASSLHELHRAWPPRLTVGAADDPEEPTGPSVALGTHFAIGLVMAVSGPSSSLQGVPAVGPGDLADARPNGCRVVVTGGPGGGKTTAADLFRRELGDEVVIVPEAATLLFSGGFPRYRDDEAVRAAQRAIYAVQRGLEDTQAAHYPGRILICDRGTIDGGIYWPDSDVDAFLREVGSTVEEEMARYDAVIFFESAAVGGISVEGTNPARIESAAEAVELDLRLRELWQRHRHFLFIPHNQSFFKKVASGLVALESVVAQLRRRILTRE